MNTKVLFTGGGIALTVVVPAVTLSNSSSSTQQVQSVQQELNLVSSQNSDSLGQVTVNSEESVRGSKSETSGSTTSTQSKSPTISKAPQPKYAECKEVARDKWIGKLIMCYNKSDDTKVTFTFVESLSTLAKRSRRVDGPSYKVGNLEVKSPYLATEVIGKYGSRLWLDLPKDVPVEKRDFSYSNPKIKKEQCTVTWITDEAGERVDWKVKC